MRHIVIPLIAILCTVTGSQVMSDQSHLFISPVDGAYEILELGNLRLSKKTPRTTDLDTQSATTLFPEYTIRKLGTRRDNNWKIINVVLFKDKSHAASIRISIAKHPTLERMSERIEAPFLGITGPVVGLHIDKNGFSDYTASLDPSNSFVVSAKGNVVVHTNINYDLKEVDGIEINNVILDYLFE